VGEGAGAGPNPVAGLATPRRQRPPPPPLPADDPQWLEGSGAPRGTRDSRAGSDAGVSSVAATHRASRMSHLQVRGASSGRLEAGPGSASVASAAAVSGVPGVVASDWGAPVSEMLPWSSNPALPAVGFVAARLGSKQKLTRRGLSQRLLQGAGSYSAPASPVASPAGSATAPKVAELQLTSSADA
jgi:hypothetical protein